MTEGHPISIAALLDSGAAPRPHEAVAIVLELCGHLTRRREAAGVMSAISPSTVTIDESGVVGVSGGVPGEDEQTVSLVGRLLLEMLDHSAGRVEAAVPPRLRATALRAASEGQKAFATAAHFVSALRRHGPDYGQSQAIRELFDRWSAGRTGGRSGIAEVVAAPTPDRRRNSPPPDLMRRFLREADEEACRARVEASLVASGEPPDGVGAAPRWARFGRAVLVGAMLLLLAGAGFVFITGGTVDELPLVAPLSKPTPALPAREPGWELLRKPERASLGPLPAQPVLDRRGGQGPGRELTAPPPTDAPPTGRHP